jgi:3-dehydroquinate synthase
MVVHWWGEEIREMKRAMKKRGSGTVLVKAGAGKYGVVCATGLLKRAGREIDRLGRFSSVHVVSSPRVWRAVGKAFAGSFARGAAPVVHLFDDAEARKNLASVELLARKLVRTRADRRALLVAVGGGVVGDVAGFVAASYLRGVALVQVPTTLVAQVDSAVGGKTGVNLPEGKNLVGAFYPPRLVLADPEALRSLPEREFRGGLAEVIKYGVIADAKLFAYLEENLEKILRREAGALEHIIRRSIEIKAWVVSQDEKESGLREILNYGHTFGHALEAATRYRRYQHGEAVAWGMMCAALLGYGFVQTPGDAVSRIVALIKRVGPLPGWPKASAKKLFALMHADKKARGGRVRFVLAPRLGKAASYDDVPAKMVECVLRCAPECLQRPVVEIVSEATGKIRG